MGAFARDYLIPIMGGDLDTYNGNKKKTSKKPFKVIIAGSRSFKDYELLRRKCDNILKDMEQEIWIISGTANGTDKLGEKYAQERGYYLMECPAQWDDIEDKPNKEIGTTKTGKKYWKLAGHRRNELMAQEADALILFNMGTPGSNNMLQQAKLKRLKIREIKI